MATTLEGSTYRYFNHTPHDSTELAGGVVSKGILVNADGNVVTQNEAGQNITHYELKAGIIYPIRTKLIRASGTTATQATVYH